MGDTGGKTKNRSGLIGFLLILILFSATAIIIVKEFDVSTLVERIVCSENTVYLCVASAMMLVYLVCYAIFIRMTMKELSVKLGRFRALLYSCLDFFYTSATPGGCGGPAGAAVTMTSDGIPGSASGAAVIMQAIVFRTVLLVFGAVSGVMIGTGFIETERTFRILFLVGAGISLLLTLAFLLALFFTPCARRIGLLFISIASKFGFIRDRQSATDSFESSLSEYRAAAVLIKKSRRLLLKMFAVTFVQRASLFSVSYLVYLSLGGCEHGFFYVFFLQTAVALAVDSLPIPGGIGLNEYAFFMLYGRMYADESDAATAMLLTRAFCYYIPLLCTSVIALARHIYAGIREKRRLGQR